MIIHRDNVKPGDSVRNSTTGESYDVTHLAWRLGRGWEAHTRAPDGYLGPTFSPDCDRMPDPDPRSYADDVPA